MQEAIESCLTGNGIEFIRGGVVIATDILPPHRSQIAAVLSRNGVTPANLARQAQDIEKQLDFDQD